MGRTRTTSCVAAHYGPCRYCANIRKRRSRSKRANVERSNPARAAEQRANAYVATYLKRGAIVPPDSCELCLRQPIASRSRSAPLVAWHPDPARVRDVAWLCRACRVVVRATRQDLELAWVWPGVAAPRRRGPLPPVSEAKAVATAAAASFESKTLPGLRETAFIATFLKTLPADVRERLYAEGAFRGDRTPLWAPYDDPEIDPFLRNWVRGEWQRRTQDAREAGVRIVTPLPARERAARTDRLPATPRPLKSERSPAKPPQSPEEAARSMAIALEHAAAAIAAADDANARAAALFEQLRRERR